MTSLPVRAAPARPTEQDINRFVTRFYAEVRKDPELGPIFDERIGAHWPEHLDRMVEHPAGAGPLTRGLP